MWSFLFRGQKYFKESSNETAARNRVFERGNVLTIAIGAVALTATASAVAVKGLVGPVKTAQRVAQQNIVQSQQLAGTKILAALAADTDCDTDNIVEPAEWRTGSGPAGGGLLPADLGLSLSDPWGTEYGYCVWNHGVTTSGGGCTGTNYLAGDGSADSPNAVVMAIVSAGPDRSFQTSCAAGADPDTQVTMTAGGDDVIFAVSYAEAGTGSGLWQLDASDTTVAEIAKNLEIMEAGTSNVAASIGQQDLSSYGLGTQQGVASFNAIKVENLFNNSTAGNPITFNDPLANVVINDPATDGGDCSALALGTLGVDASGMLFACSDVSGSQVWEPTGDDLGDHIATADLNLDGNAITNAGNIGSTGTITTTGTINANTVNATGDISAANVAATGGDVSSATVTATGQITGEGLDAGAGAITTTGNINGADLAGTGNLDITGTSQLDGAVTLGSTLQAGGNINLNGHYLSGDGGNEGVSVDSAGVVYINTGSTNSLVLDNASFLAGRESGGAIHGLIGLSTGDNTTLRSPSQFVFQQGQLGSQVDVMRIDENGWLGVGESNPAAMLDVAGAANIGGTITAGAGDSHIAGNLGIGDPTPGSKLEVAGTIRANEICDRTGTVCIDMTDLSGSGGGDLGYWTASGSDIYYDSGNVGINKTSPSYTLDVNGTVAANTFVLDATTIDDVDDLDPKVGALTDTKWCRVSGSQIVCDQDTPNGLPTTCSANQILEYDGADWQCIATPIGGGGSDTLSTLNCQANEIPKWNGTAWVCSNDTVSGNPEGITNTIVTGWPDSIVCNRTGGAIDVLYTLHMPFTNGFYYYRNVGNSGILFNNAGIIHSEEINYTNCNPGTTVADLYAAGRAFQLANKLDSDPDIFSFVDVPSAIPNTFYEASAVVSGFTVPIRANILAAGSIAYDCPAGYTAHNGSCYRFVTTTANFNQARAACQADTPSADLVVIDDMAENNYINDQLPGSWIGLQDIDIEGHFVWSDGTVARSAGLNYTFTNWNPSEPNNQSNEDCINLTTAGRWNDWACTNLAPYTCEFDGNPQIRKNGTSVWDSSVIVNSGDTVNVRMISPNNSNMTNSAVVTVGSRNDTWDISTTDLTPTTFDLTNQINVAASTQILSNIVTITSIDAPLPVAVTGQGSPVLRIDGGAWVTSGTISNGQTLQLRLTSAPGEDVNRTATVTVHKVSDSWSVRTIDTTPNTYNFVDNVGVASNTVYTSNTSTINGITVPVTASVSGGDARIRINGGAWVTSGAISNGQTLQVRMTSDANPAVIRTATVNVGGVTDTWSIYQTHTSCLQMLNANPSRPSGNYTIDPDGAGPIAPFTAYCDMTTDGGGYTFYAINNGIRTYRSTDNNSCKALGMDIVIPRTQAHLNAMFTQYGSAYFNAVPGVTKPSNGGNFTGCIMRDPNAYGTGCAQWRALDGGRWWLRDSTYSEPNGDYTANCWLGSRNYVASNYQLNDGNCGISTINYICSTNDKP